MAKAKELQELGDFKVGQQVYCESRLNTSISTIDRITDGRNGTIYVNGTSYDSKGYQRGDIWATGTITPATEEHKRSMIAKRARYRLARYEWQKLSDDNAIAIEKLLRDNGFDIKPQ